MLRRPPRSTRTDPLVPYTTLFRSSTAHVPDQPGLKLILTRGVMITLGPLTIDMYLPALPDIEVDLATTEAAVQLTLTGTLIGLALGQLVVGPLSDAFGRRMPLVLGTLLHVLTSLLCLFAPSKIGRAHV